MLNNSSSNDLLNMPLEDVKVFASSCPNDEMANALAFALKDSNNIRAREDVYVEKVPDEILKRSFEIVK